MAGLLEFQKRIDSIDVLAESQQAITENVELIKDLNRERMLEGRKTDGTFQKNYSKVSQEKFGYPDEPIKLKATGAFQDAITVEVDNDLIKTTSTDSKTTMLTEKYTEKIFGLGKPDKIDLVPPLKKTLVKNIKDKLKI